MLEDPEDRLGMTEEQWEEFKRLTRGFGDQDENGIDLSMLKRNLQMTPTQRLNALQPAHDFFLSSHNGSNPL